MLIKLTLTIRTMLEAILLTSCFTMSAHANLLVGQITGMTGPIAASSKESLAGAKLYLDHVNSKGGVYGEKIELLVLDDKFDPKLSKEKAEELILQKKVLALFMNRGTAHIDAIKPIMTQNGVPLIGPASGSSSLRKPVHPLIFNIRASYQREASKVISHLKLIGVTKIAAVAFDDPFGNDILEGVRSGFESSNIIPSAIIKAQRANLNLQTIVDTIIKSQATSVLWIGDTSFTASGIKALRIAGFKAQIITLSNNAFDGFIDQLGDLAQGVVVTQVFPSERNFSFAIAREARELAKTKGINNFSPVFFEGYISAKVLVEGLRRAGPKPTRSALVKALDNLNRYDIGGLEISYTPSNHSGLDFVELSIIGSEGRFKR